MIANKIKRVLQHFLLPAIFSLLSVALLGANAPITTIQSTVNAIPGHKVAVPITVTGFENIGGITLALDYDYAKLQFISGTQNPELGGMCSIGDIDLENGYHRLTISWFKFGTGVNLPDGTSVVDYVFNFVSGPATLSWFDMGPSCVFNNPDAVTLTDTPTSIYYNNGVISSSPVINAEVTTSTVSDISKQSATVKGNITKLGNPNPIAYGICWSTNAEPTVADSITTEGEATTAGVFSSTLSGLIPGTTYYVRAYATNYKFETVYGDVISFTTQMAAEVATTEITKITDTGATANCQLINLGIPNAKAYGVCWSTDTVPTIADKNINLGEATSAVAFNSVLIGLIPSTIYYVRAYATNSLGETVYGEVLSFSTFEAAQVATNEISKITDTGATANCSLNAMGNTTVTAYGICWGTESEPTISNNSVTATADSTGNFSADISGLTPGTTYYVRAYVSNAIGTTYGEVISFVSYKLPEVSTAEVGNITINTASLKGNLFGLGIPSASDFGVCWSTSPNPTIFDFVTDIGTAAVEGDFSTELINLIPNTIYYARAFAKNELGIVYGDVITFTSLKKVGVSDFGYAELKVYAYNNELFIRSNENIKADVAVYNLLGERVLLDRINGKEQRIPFNQKGIYIVKIQNNSKLISQRIVF